MKTIKIYVAGSVSPDSTMGTSFWRDEFCEKLGKSSGTKIINLDPTSRKTLPFDTQTVFGRDCFLIKNSDLVIVNMTDDIGIAREGGKFVNKEHNDFGRVVDFIHPFVLATCDAVVHDEAEAAVWIREHYGKEKPKGIECIDASISYYLENYFDIDGFAKRHLEKPPVTDKRER